MATTTIDMKRIIIPLALFLAAAPVSAEQINLNRDDLDKLYYQAFDIGRMLESFHTKCLVYTGLAQLYPKKERIWRIVYLDTIVPNWMNLPKHAEAKKIAIDMALERFGSKEYSHNGKLCAKTLLKLTKGR